ncbi:TIGR01621 family pseudouridine synthase [Alginatibacterium sediminis]|uniref:TIGR01621 family pseudouridine synthase n=1 Tax=Alginatibacterium sediminis TaxID=2164068 RepID=A0A420EJP9_9ALTE|nr:TIGR01621 family pseudouridine synthase [Alginatibacterium sediminis]RKF20888.1 TIGR01621 family pseudouridine synthase [Alginatibacterium sediminis]
MLVVVCDHVDFVVVEKPAGIEFHSFKNEQLELQAGFAQQLSQELGYRIWPVHRLDKVTSGCLIFAKSAEAAARFQELFSRRKIDKYYLALAAGKPKKKQGLIKGDMLRTRNGSWKLSHTLENPAITQFLSFSVEPGQRCYLLKPYSGKTHQLRVAMKSLGTPILGDSRYGGVPASRTYLHCFAMRFEWDGEVVELLAKKQLNELWLREDYQHIIHKLSPPWLRQFPKLNK